MQTKPVTENIQGQITVAVVIAMKESPFLIAMHRIIGSVKVNNNMLRSFRVTVQKNIHQTSLHRLAIDREPFVFICTLVRIQFQSIERALAGQRLTPIFRTTSILAARIWLFYDGRQQILGPQLIVIVQVFITQSQSVYALTNQFA